MMKIARHLRSDAQWPFEVEGKRCPSYGAALAVAMDRAGRTRSRVSVQEYGDVVAVAVPDEHGTVRLFAA